MLTARIHMLEEHIREIEVRGEERLLEEQRRNKDLVQRLEREKQLEIENYTIRLQGMEKEQRVLGEEVACMRSQLEKAREEKGVVEEQLCEVQGLLIGEQERHRQLQESRARELEQWGEEKAASLGMVQEMSREVRKISDSKSIDNFSNLKGRGIKEAQGRNFTYRVWREVTRWRRSFW